MFFSPGCPSASAEDDAGADHKAEVIPSAIVMYLVHMYAVSKERNYECERGDETMPESPEKSRVGAKFIGDTFRWVPPGET